MASYNMTKKIAVIGAGISGSLFTHMLGDCTKVTLFEKARGPGGRLSSHRYGSYSTLAIYAASASW